MNRGIWIFSWILIIIGLIIYFSWAFMYNAWTDVGLYSITVTMLTFGVLGVILAKVEKKE